MFPIFLFVAWTLKALADGFNPSQRHDGPWLSSDTLRAAVAGFALGFKGVVIDVKGDWCEFANGWGFPTWSSLFAPCLFCNVLKRNLLNFKRLADGSWPFQLHTDDAYEEDALSHTACYVCVAIEKKPGKA